MKKDRNCGVPYPIYQPYQGIPYMPNMMGPVPFDTGMPNMNMPTSTSTSDQSINNLQEQITLLNKRVTNLETMLNSNNNVSQYSSSNYQMM